MRPWRCVVGDGCGSNGGGGDSISGGDGGDDVTVIVVTFSKMIPCSFSVILKRGNEPTYGWTDRRTDVWTDGHMD